jgi:hypothetical protein
LTGFCILRCGAILIFWTNEDVPQTRMSALGHSLLTHFALAPINVRCCSNSGQTRVRRNCQLSAISDQILRRSEVTLSAKSDHRSQSKDLDRTHIFGTRVPVEEPSTASIADIPKETTF